MIDGIMKICEFAFSFSNMNTLFIDDNSNIKLEYLLTNVPESLKPYFSGIIDRLRLNDPESEYNVTFHSDSFRLNYISAKVYDDDNYLGSILVGPYLLEDPTIFMIESVVTDNKMVISLKNIVKHYFLSLPMISSYKAKITAEFLSYMVSTFNRNCFDNQKIGSLKYEFQTEYTIPSDKIRQNTDQAMESLEKRYSLENKMLHAVESGDRGLFDLIIRENTSFMSMIPDRVPNDPLRSMKNFSIVLNTLLRKAAEKGGLHPIYLDSLSSKYAIQIEKSSSFQQMNDLVHEMQIEYCDTVRNLSLKNYSASVRKAIEFIRINLGNDLSLDSISSAIHLSPSELSRQFKKETGETITEYINKIRINEAIFILENENVSITDTAFIVGFNDVNYFTKVFKKIKGITPSEYRKSKS